MSHRQRRAAIGTLACLVALSACSYDSAQDDLGFEMNSCSTATECAEGDECLDGMCVAQSVDAPLTIALQVTPLRTADGSDPLPIVLERFRVEGPMARTFELPSSVEISGSVRNAGVQVDAELSFAPIGAVPGFAPRMITTTASANVATQDADFRVRLSRDQPYRVLVRPRDPELPPYSQTLVASDDQRLDIEYAALLVGHARTFTVTGAPTDRVLLVRALDLATSEPLSSTATVTATGTALLKFLGEPPALRIEISAEQSYDTGETAVLDPPPCDLDTPEFPVFTVAEEDLEIGEDGNPLIELPQAPARIRFEGTVALCDEAAAAGTLAPIDSLPITLHSESVLLPAGTKLSAANDTTTAANIDPETGDLRFCVEVMPGTYEVLASPASNIPCSLYADRLIVAPASGGNASGARLLLPETAHLQGMLQTTDGMPVRAVAIDAIALGRSAGIELSEIVTRHNRSRQTETGDDGSFDLAIDVGSYDVVIKPPAGSGFSWQLRHDVKVGRREEFGNQLDMVSPVAVEGRLRLASGEGSVAGAEIAAFAIIDDEDVAGSAGDSGSNSERAVPIGRATADPSGRFTLLLPPSIRAGW